jgi:hypothetical protein
MARLDPGQLRAAARDLPEDGVRLGQLLALAPGGQVPAMVVLCTLPAALPGLQLGWVCVPVLLYLSCALWQGQSAPTLPARLARSAITRKSAHAMLHGVAWVVEQCGRHCRTTWPALVRRTRRKPAAALVAAMALVILLPLPGSNVVPAMAIVALMAGLVWRDGRAVVAAAVLSVLSVLVVAGLSWAAWATLSLWP